MSEIIQFQTEFKIVDNEPTYTVIVDCKSQKEMDDLVKQIKHTKGMHWTEVLWEPVENDDGEDIIRLLSELPDDGEEVIMTDGKNIWTDLWEDAWGFESTDVTLRKGRIFWMSFPEPYKVKEGK